MVRFADCYKTPPLPVSTMTPEVRTWFLYIIFNVLEESIYTDIELYEGDRNSFYNDEYCASYYSDFDHTWIRELIINKTIYPTRHIANMLIKKGFDLYVPGEIGSRFAEVLLKCGAPKDQVDKITTPHDPMPWEYTPYSGPSSIKCDIGATFQPSWEYTYLRRLPNPSHSMTPDVYNWFIDHLVDMVDWFINVKKQEYHKDYAVETAISSGGAWLAELLCIKEQREIFTRLFSYPEDTPIEKIVSIVSQEISEYTRPRFRATIHRC